MHEPVVKLMKFTLSTNLEKMVAELYPKFFHFNRY